ncbi:MAG: glycosyltransferase family 4 protein [Spirosomataceae bacterium]
MQQKIKVFHIIHALKIGGVETAALSSLEVLNKHYDFRLIVIDKDLDKIEVPDFIRPYIVVFNGKYPFDLFNYYKIADYINTEKPKIIISSLWRSIFTILLAKIIFRDFIWISFFHSTFFKHYLDKIFNKVGFKLSNHTFVDSVMAKKFVNQWTSDNKISIISFLRQKSQNFRHIDFKDLRMVYIGRINEMKGIEIGIKLQHHLLNYYNILIPFDIYGPDEDYLDKLKVLAHELEVTNFTYCGVLSPQKVNVILSEYNLFFQASQYEGMAMSVVEAMQSGLVCIVTPVGEIQHYTQNLISAIHIQEVNNYNFEELSNILNDELLLKEISKNAQKVFSNYLSYSESLLFSLQKIQSVYL